MVKSAVGRYHNLQYNFTIMLPATLHGRYIFLVLPPLLIFSPFFIWRLPRLCGWVSKTPTHFRHSSTVVKILFSPIAYISSLCGGVLPIILRIILLTSQFGGTITSNGQKNPQWGRWMQYLTRAGVPWSGRLHYCCTSANIKKVRVILPNIQCRPQKEGIG